MNIKKILAGAVASVMAVSSLAITASAADFKTEYTYKNSAANLNLDTSGAGFYTQAQLGHIQKIDSLTISYETADGTTGYALIQTNWGGDPAVEANAFKWDGGSFETWTGANVMLPEGVAVEGTTMTFTAITDVASEWAQYIAKYPDAAEAAAPDMIILTVGGGKGSIIAEYASDAAPAETDETPAETDAAPAETDDAAPAETTAAPAGNDTVTNAPSSDKGNADTGVEGVAAVAGLAIIAAGAVVIAKKRK